MDFCQVRARATASGSTVQHELLSGYSSGSSTSGSTSSTGTTIRWKLGPLSLVLPVKKELLSVESLGNSVCFYQSNMDYYQVIGQAQQCLVYQSSMAFRSIKWQLRLTYVVLAVLIGLLKALGRVKQRLGLPVQNGLLSGYSSGQTTAVSASLTWTKIRQAKAQQLVSNINYYQMTKFSFEREAWYRIIFYIMKSSSMPT